MRRKLVNFSGMGMLGLALVATSVTGCGEKPTASTQYKPAAAGEVAPDAPATQAFAPPTASMAAPPAAGEMAKPAAIAVDTLDADSLPDGPPAALLEYMKHKDTYKPRGVTRDQEDADLIRVKKLVIVAGDRLLAHPDATVEERREGAGLKLSALTEIAHLGEPKANQDLLAFCTRLKQDKAPELSRLGRLMLLSMEVAKLQQGEIDDARPIISELKALLKGDDRERVDFTLGKQIGVILVQLGNNQASAEVLRAIGEKYQNDTNEVVAGEARQVLKQVKLVELDFPKKFNALFEPKTNPNAPQQVLEVVQVALSDPNLDASDLSMAAMSADRLERSDNYREAAAVLDLIEQRFGNSNDPKVAGQVKEALSSGRARLQLIGKPLRLTGNTLDGQPLNTAALRGKIVLVDFWATWCDPCLAEIPNIKQYYQQYHDKGFEVIGYNLDEDPKQVEQFFMNQSLPWPTVVSEDPNRVGFASPLATLCGVQSIPFLVLLDGQGRVIALHVRGEKLGEKLAELLGPPGQ